MPKDGHELQRDPPEGSREVIDRELERQENKETGAPPGKPSRRTDDGPKR